MHRQLRHRRLEMNFPSEIRHILIFLKPSGDTDGCADTR
jgi:hypothetical protein